MHWTATHIATRLAGPLAALCLFSTAHAGTIDFEPVVGTIQGSNTVVFEFDILGTGSGLYRAILTDFESPAPFQIFGVGIATLDGTVLVQDFGESMLQVDFTVDPARHPAPVRWRSRDRRSRC